MFNAAELYQGRGCGPGWDKWGQTRVKKVQIESWVGQVLECLS